MIEERLHLLWKVKDMLKEEKQKEKRKQRKLESSV